MKKKNDNQTYNLQELVGVNIDSWVAAMGNLDDEKGFREEALAISDEETRASWAEDECPAELEDAFTFLANRDKYRFDANGNIVSFEKYHK